MKTLKENRIVILTFLAVAYAGAAITFEDALFVRQAFENHRHDGLYILNQSMLGQKTAWILDGNELEVIGTGGNYTRKCSQGPDFIILKDGDVRSKIQMDEEGSFILTDQEIKSGWFKMDLELKMVRVRNSTDYEYKEVMMLLDTAYVE